MQGKQQRTLPEVPQPEVCGVADGCDQVPVGAVAGGPSQLRGSPSQRTHGAVCCREVQQQLHAALPRACAAAQAACTRDQRAHLPACDCAIPATSLNYRLVIMGSWICDVMALQRS